MSERPGSPTRSDAKLLAGFLGAGLSREDWTHRGHVRVAFLLLRESGFDEALPRLREGIQQLNAALGVEEGPQKGYHETTTVAFLTLIDVTMRVHGERLPTPDSDSFCDAHPQLMNKQLLRSYYSLERWSEPAAKTTFVEPDLAPLPRAPGDG